MAENENTDSVVVEASSTPAPTDSTETTAVAENVQTDPKSDPWNFDKLAGDEKDEGKEPVKTEEPEAKSDEPAKTDEKVKTPEDEILEEAFAEKKEEPKEEDLDNLNPEEMIAAQRNQTARNWAERRDKKAVIVDDFERPNKDTGVFVPIADVANKFKERNEGRYTEFSQYAAHQLVDANPDQTFKRAYVVKMLQQNPNWDYSTANIPTLDELIAGNGTNGTNGHEPAKVAPELSELTADLDKTLDWDWRNPALDENFVDDRELALATSLRAMEAKVKSETAGNSELSKKLEKLEKDLEGLTTVKTDDTKAVMETKLFETIKDYRSSVETVFLPHALRNAGLEVSKDDTPEIAAFKESRKALYTGSDYERANGIDSPFEAFAYNQSTVKTQLHALTERLVDIQLKETKARLANNTADVQKYHAEAEDEKIPLYQLLGQAGKEFSEKMIKPDMELIGKLSGKLAEPIKEASARQEVVSNGAGIGTSRPKTPDHRTMEDVFNAAAENVANEERLRVNA